MSDSVDISKMSDDDLQDRFSEVFEKEIAAYNGIESFECICKRDGEFSDPVMEVMIVGMAGSPTADEYKTGDLKNTKKVEFEIEGKGKIEFAFAPEKTFGLNTNDYMVFYEKV